MNPKKHKALKHYLDYIKPFTDKRPYLKKILKIIWIKIYRLQLKLNSIYLAADLNKTYWINPERILFSQLRSESSNRLYENKIRKTFKYGRKICNIVKIEDKAMYQSFHFHFIRGKKWKETDYYKQVVHRIKGGESLWRCSSVKEYNERCAKLDKLYVRIKNNGLESQKTLNKNTLLKESRILNVADEITILVGPEGEMIHSHSGTHRLNMAKVIGLDKVPVQILYRHKNWLRFRKEMIKYIRREMRGKAYQPILHPDLSDIPSLWSDKRFKIIRNNLSAREGTLLDIGAHWGYFCNKFENLGFQCTALESHEKNPYFMKKLKRAEMLNFDIIEKSIFDEDLLDFLEEPISFDIVIALNLFNQKIDIGKEGIADRFSFILRKIKAKELYLQIPGEEASQGLDDKDKRETENFSYRNLMERIMDNTQFSQVKKIGEERSCSIYKLS